MRAIAVAVCLCLFASCDVYYHVNGIVVDSETGLPVDTFTVYEIDKHYHPDTNKATCNIHLPKDSGKFEANKMTGAINTQPLHLKIYAPGYELVDLPDLKNEDNLVVKMKKIR